MFVVLFDDADEDHDGKDTCEPGVHVIEPAVEPVYVVPALFLIVPEPLYLFNVIVTDVAWHEEEPPVLRSFGWFVPAGQAIQLPFDK